MTGTPRRAAAILLAAIPFATVVVTAVVLRPRLGPTIASHWTRLDRPDAIAATWPMFGVATAVCGAGLLIAVVAIVAGLPAARPIALVAQLVGGGSAFAWVTAAAATAAAPDPRSAALGGLIVLLLVPVPLALGVWALTPPAQVTGSGATAPVLPLRDGERVAYRTVIGSVPLAIAEVVVVALGAVLLAVGVAGRATVLVGPSVALLIAGVSIAFLVPVRLTVDARGVRLASVLLGIPLIRVPLSAIESVTAEHIEPLQWGGWGYRFTASGRAYVARRGPGIVVHRRGGSTVAITVGEAAQPAAVANALVARAALTR